jgi:hypothetical protein
VNVLGKLSVGAGTPDSLIVNVCVFAVDVTPPTVFVAEIVMLYDAFLKAAYTYTVGVVDAVDSSKAGVLNDTLVYGELIATLNPDRVFPKVMLPQLAGLLFVRFCVPGTVKVGVGTGLADPAV